MLSNTDVETVSSDITRLYKQTRSHKLNLHPNDHCLKKGGSELPKELLKSDVSENPQKVSQKTAPGHTGNKATIPAILLHHGPGIVVPTGKHNLSFLRSTTDLLGVF